MKTTQCLAPVMHCMMGIALLAAPALSIAVPASAVTTAGPRGEQPAWDVERLGEGPVIHADMPGLKGELGENIDGPSVIRVPDWIENPLGKYYMYFAHHRGEYIRLAYADSPEGPWTVYEPGTLKLGRTSAVHHIASPDVIVDEANRRLVLYFHGPVEMPGVDYGGRPYRQRSFAATSANGIDFTPASGAIAPPYMKAFHHGGMTYGLAMADKRSAYPLWLRSGQFVRSEDGVSAFEEGPRIIDEMRHAALLVDGDILRIFYTRIGAEPERIMSTTVDLRPDWSEWTATAPVEVLRPEKNYEGADVPLEASAGGMSYGREHAVRDPGVLKVGDAIYLYYSIAGERGIAVAKVTVSTDRR